MIKKGILLLAAGVACTATAPEDRTCRPVGGGDFPGASACARVVGNIVDESGNAVGDIDVSIRMVEDDRSDGGIQTSRADRRGRFTIELYRFHGRRLNPDTVTVLVGATSLAHGKWGDDRAFVTFARTGEMPEAGNATIVLKFDIP